mmetsp:Transcript_6672/g.21073  ORF Transcript_6672/g.21073 Transcript_6672/m.21073 type:complete len:220 (+) Transcript_6672:669-1328(+)
MAEAAIRGAAEFESGRALGQALLDQPELRVAQLQQPRVVRPGEVRDEKRDTGLVNHGSAGPSRCRARELARCLGGCVTVLADKDRRRGQVAARPVAQRRRAVERLVPQPQHECAVPLAASESQPRLRRQQQRSGAGRPEVERLERVGVKLSGAQLGRRDAIVRAVLPISKERQLSEGRARPSAMREKWSNANNVPVKVPTAETLDVLEVDAREGVRLGR